MGTQGQMGVRRAWVQKSWPGIQLDPTGRTSFFFFFFRSKGISGSGLERGRKDSQGINKKMRDHDS